ncbi:MAG: hypothetical protein KGV56_04240, partial [Gammaproteobacteria bacterium]|nr:hypothetical protein [Gammaproteobacteria bacterium]
MYCLIRNYSLFTSHSPLFTNELRENEGKSPLFKSELPLFTEKHSLFTPVSPLFKNELQGIYITVRAYTLTHICISVGDKDNTTTSSCGGSRCRGNHSFVLDSILSNHLGVYSVHSSSDDLGVASGYTSESGLGVAGGYTSETGLDVAGGYT